MMANSLEERIAELEHQVERINDRHAIEMLVGDITTCWSQKNMSRAGEFFAYEMPDVSLEVGDRGMYVGKDELEKLFQVEYQIPYNEGNMLRHFYTTPQIEVADDGKTAEGTWWLIGIETIMNKDDIPQAVWCFCMTAYDFIKIDDKWKIWHVHWYVVAKCDYEKGWAKDYDQWTTQWIDRDKYEIADGVKVEKHAGAKTTWHNPHTPKWIQEAAPAGPVPYKTWKNSNWIFRHCPEFIPKDIPDFDPDDPDYQVAK